MIYLPRIQGKTLVGKTIWLDFIHLDDVTLDGCRLIYFGLGGIKISGNVNLKNCSIRLFGPAGKGFAVGRDLEALGASYPDKGQNA